MANPNLPARIKKVRKALGNLTQPAFAEGLGVSRATIAGIETGRSNLTFDQLQSVLNVYNVDPVYLLTGEGDIFRTTKKYITPPNPLEIAEPNLPYTIKGSPLVTIQAQAGYSQEMQTHDTLPIVRIPGLQDDNARVFEVSGESMDPILNHGDYIACRKVASAHELRDGLLYVVVARDHGVSVKYVRRTHNSLRCIPQNTASYSPYNVPLDEVIELWEVQVRITRNILNNLVETVPVRLQARFERLEKVIEHLLTKEEDRNQAL